MNACMDCVYACSRVCQHRFYSCVYSIVVFQLHDETERVRERDEYLSSFLNEAFSIHVLITRYLDLALHLDNRKWNHGWLKNSPSLLFVHYKHIDTFSHIWLCLFSLRNRCYNINIEYDIIYSENPFSDPFYFDLFISISISVSVATEFLDVKIIIYFTYKEKPIYSKIMCYSQLLLNSSFGQI